MFCWCLQIHTDDELVGSVLSDLSQRHGQILDIDHRQDHRLIHSLVPLSELVGYSTTRNCWDTLGYPDDPTNCANTPQDVTGSANTYDSWTNASLLLDDVF